LFDKVEEEVIFENPSIPFRVRKKGDKIAIYSVDENRLVVPYKKNKIFLSRSNEHDFYTKSGKRVLILNGKEESYLFVDNKLDKTVQKMDFNFFSMNPNINYICIKAHKGGEAIWDIKNRKYVTPQFNSIYPAPDFPRTPYYKATSHAGTEMDYGEAIYSFPDNKQMTKYYNNISSVGHGILGGFSDYYYTEDEHYNKKYWKKWGIPFLQDMPNYLVGQILGDLQQQIKGGDRGLIKRVFKMRFK